MLASMKSITYYEHPSCNLQETCSCFQEAARDSKSCSESRLVILKLFWKLECHVSVV